MENKNLKKYKFHVSGTPCKSCALVIEEEVGRINGIDSACVDFYKNELEISSSLTRDKKELSKILNDAVSHYGYKISTEKSRNKTDWSQFIYAIPASFAVIVVFYALQRIGLVNFLNNNGDLDYTTVFIIGIVASLSSCLAVVGGLVLSLSANQSRGDGGILAQILFHTGRIGGFFVLGGLVGVLGNSLYLTANVSLTIGVLFSTVMLILGLNLLDIFEITKKIQFVMPKSFGDKIRSGAKNKNYLTAILLGALTFFLPCGFTQSMQMYALSTHDFWRGALIMLVFSLGTLPVLSLLSFSSFSVNNKEWSGIFYKTVGILIVFLSIFNLLGALSAYGLINPIFNI